MNVASKVWGLARDSTAKSISTEVDRLAWIGVFMPIEATLHGPISIAVELQIIELK
jgi:hypothetical protein